MFSPDTILQGGGLLVVGLVLFAETGLLFGIIFPGDSLLLAGGVLASQGKLNIWLLVPVCVISSIVGYEVGYYVGRKSGPHLFKREDGLIFKKEYIDRTTGFFKRHGGKTILLARFVPYVRTFVSFVAGVGGMNKRLYNIYNVAGGILWAGGVTLLSYYLGRNIPNFDKIVLFGVLITLVLFHLIIFWHLLHDKKRRQNVMNALRQDWNHYFGKKKKT